VRSYVKLDALEKNNVRGESAFRSIGRGTGVGGGVCTGGGPRGWGEVALGVTRA
jgi:hypothetical protein